ncbi:Tol-Pal system peptidoglycan-associated lipoprotein PAL [Olavius algarvensis Delta 1 endosymbiont]|nr:Tol-Pal system peptidoglycan-associated lipoprotein PAL [Olavius algarvensis Delta 1 endosymbiont]
MHTILLWGAGARKPIKYFWATWINHRSRMTTKSYGEERPLAHGHSEAAWAKNRRAHFLIKKDAKNLINAAGLQCFLTYFSPVSIRRPAFNLPKKSRNPANHFIRKHGRHFFSTAPPHLSTALPCSHQSDRPFARR